MHNKLIYKFLSLICTVVLVLSLFPAKSSAESADYPAEDGRSEEETVEQPVNTPYTEKGIINVLLLGLDYREKWGEANTRADTNIICSFNINTGEIKLISIERGVAFRISDSWYMPEFKILTHVYNEGGPELSLKVVSRDFNVDLAGYVSVNFQSFSKIVDALGGVDLELTESEAASLNKEAPTNAWTNARVEPGINHLDGHDALEYCRLRFNDSDWHRMERQQKCLQACMDQLKHLNIKQIKDLIQLVLDNVETNVPLTTITNLTLHAGKFLFDPKIEKMVTPEKEEGWYTKDYIECDFSKESARIKEFIYG